MIKSRISQEHGFSLIEILVALLVMTVALLAVGASLISAKRTTFGAKRHAAAVHIAQLQLEKMRGTDYDKLALPTGTTVVSPPNDLIANHIFFGGWLQVRVVSPQMWERFAFSPTAAVVHTENFTANGISGTIYRYVTWRGSCGLVSCMDKDESKRITVAVSLAPPGNGAAPFRPVFVSSVVAPGAEGANTDPAHEVGKPQNFYLYDSQCDATAWYPAVAPATTPHAVHDTAAEHANIVHRSNCRSATQNRRPDLMGPRLPGGTSNASGGTLAALPPRFGNDSTYDSIHNPGGIALLRRSPTNCTLANSSYNANATTGSTVVAERNQIHRWVTGPFASKFLLNGEATFYLRTHLTGGTGGSSLSVDGSICIVLFERVDNGTEAYDKETLAAGKCGPQSDWPQKPYNSLSLDELRPPRTCNLFIDNRSIDPGNRLGIAVWAPGDSGDSVNIFYDDPDTPTNLRVTTTTPCEAGGPCPVG